MMQLPIAVLIAFCHAQNDPPSVRAEIEDVLGAMTAAAMKPDGQAYLSHVDLSNPFFAQEQRNWVVDLEKRSPTAIALGIGEDNDIQKAEFGEERAAFNLVVEYTMPEGPAAKGARASWPAVFVKRDVDGPGPEPARWLYAGENWVELQGDGFSVKHFPGFEAVAQEVAQAFPVARAHVNGFFRVNPARTEELKLFVSMDHLKYTVYLSMPDPYLGGWNEPGESIKFMHDYTRGVPSWTGAYAHEYGHQATWELGPGTKSMPWWVAEGVAEQAAEEFKPGYADELDRKIRKRASEGTLAPWAEITDYHAAKQEYKIWAYLQGNHMLGYITLRWGWQGRIDWIAAMGAGKTLDEATREVMGRSFEELDAEWRETLRDR